MSIFNLVVTLHITPAFFQGGGVSRSGGHPQEDDQEPQREDEGQLASQDRQGIWRQEQKTTHTKTTGRNENKRWVSQVE